MAGGAHMSAIQFSEEVETPRRRVVFLIDPLLLLAAVGLVACSLVTLHGAVGASAEKRQAIYAGIGLIAVLVLMRIDYTRLREFKFALYGLMIAFNIAVYATPPIAGARRWIPLPGFSFQSSEFGKILLILALSAFAVDRSRRLHERRTTARIMLLALIPALLVIPQPDLGTGMVYVVVGFALLFFAGTSWKQLTGLVAMFVASLALVLFAAPAVGVHVLKPYQSARLTAFLHPNHCSVAPGQIDPCYQLQQAVIAIGSGQKTGRGVQGATQTKLNYLPAKDTDFIFAAIGETYGFVGAALVLSLYALLIWRSLRILTMSKNMYGTLIAAGILAMLMFQIFLNIGMTIGIMPVTGVPLPLVSYGGSSVIVTFIAIGLLQSIHIQARMTAAGKGRGRALLS